MTYGGIPAAEMAKRFRGEVVYNQEDDVHQATLTVAQTIRFALNNKVRVESQLCVYVVLTTFTPLADTWKAFTDRVAQVLQTGSLGSPPSNARNFSHQEYVGGKRLRSRVSFLF